MTLNRKNDDTFSDFEDLTFANFKRRFGDFVLRLNHFYNKRKQQFKILQEDSSSEELEEDSNMTDEPINGFNHKLSRDFAVNYKRKLILLLRELKAYDPSLTMTELGFYMTPSNLTELEILNTLLRQLYMKLARG